MSTCLERNSVHWNTELTVAGFGWWHLVEVDVFPAAARRRLAEVKDEPGCEDWCEPVVVGCMWARWTINEGKKGKGKARTRD